MTDNTPDAARSGARTAIVGVLGRLLRQAIFAVWWGGLTFYATVVIHVGTHVLGGEQQGFITQRVTYFVNGLGTLVVLALLVQIRRSRQKLPWILWGLLAVSQLGLFLDHSRLTGMLDFETSTVADQDAFYTEHAIYLWLTTVQWMAGLGWLLWDACQCTREISGDGIE